MLRNDIGKESTIPCLCQSDKGKASHQRQCNIRIVDQNYVLKSQERADTSCACKKKSKQGRRVDQIVIACVSIRSWMVFGLVVNGKIIEEYYISVKRGRRTNYD